jgi:hypothetical protein
MQIIRITKEEEMRTAFEFYSKHGDSAPFLAAAAMESAIESDGSDSFVSRSVAIAFMHQFPDVMNEWYDYNARFAEPMFGLENCPPQCRCLPRHHCVCPNPVIDIS